MTLKEELKAARLALRKVQDRLFERRGEVSRLEARVEANDYPSYQRESFMNDDLVRRAHCLQEIDDLEVEERRLEHDVTAWRNTIEAQGIK